MNQYQIVVDSGSTKTDWRIINQHGELIERIKSMGFNPYFQNSEFIYSEINKSFSTSSFESEDVSEVNYYGAGCSSDDKKSIVHLALQRQFPNAVVNVDHDLIAAARGTLGNTDGIACIIGTGANSCVWIDGRVVENIPSHGYIFGDEGSGSYLGTEILKLYLNDTLPRQFCQEIEETFGLTKNQILEATYQKNNPNVFLASFAKLFQGKMHVDLFKEIVCRGFDDFFRVRILPYTDYQNYPLGFVGSIAYYYQDILREVAESYDMHIRYIHQCPIDNLMQYHLNNKVTVR